MASPVKPHACEHCEKSYDRRGPKSSHKYSVHYGGYDCDLCPQNFRFKELLNKHYKSKHEKMANPRQDFGHISRIQREELDTEGLVRKSQGLPPLVVEHLPKAMDIEVEPEHTHPPPQAAGPTIRPEGDQDFNMAENTIGPTDSVETLVDFNQCKQTDIVDLDVANIASQENLELIVQRLMSKDLRLGVNLRAQLYLTAQNAERLFDEGLLSREQILDQLQPKCNNQ
jgi:hypothetical protein